MSATNLNSGQRLPPGATPRWMGLLPDALQALLFLGSGGAILLALASVAMASFGQPPGRGLQTVAYLLAIGVLCLAPGAAMHSASQQVAVWHLRRIPGDAARHTVHAWHRLMGILVALMVLPMLLIAALHMTGRRPPLGGAWLFEPPLLALHFAGLALLACAGWRGLLPAAWTLAGPWLLLEWLLRMAGWWPTSSVVSSLWLASALALTLPLAWSLCARQLGRPMRPRPRARSAQRSPGACWQALRGALRLRSQPIDAAGHSSLGVMLGGMVLVPVGQGKPGWLAPPWGGEVTVAIVPCLAWLTLLMLPLLRCPDVHWRTLLAPGLSGRSRLGWHILRDSLRGLAVQWVGVLVLLAVLSLIVQGVDATLAATPAALKQSATWVPEMVLALVLAVTLRGLGTHSPAARRWVFSGLVGVVTVSVLIACLPLVFHLDWLQRWTSAPLWHRDGAQAACLLALSAGLAWTATRIWARADLTSLLNDRVAKSAVMP